MSPSSKSAISGFGGAGRNTAIVRANQRTQENVPLYKEALDLWPVLTRELNFNLMFNNCGNLNLVHSEAGVKAARLNIATAQFHGVESHLLDARQVKEMEPALNIAEDITHPIHGAMYHPPGGIVRHDAVVWGLAKGAHAEGRPHSPAHRGHGHPYRGGKDCRRHHQRRTHRHPAGPGFRRRPIRPASSTGCWASSCPSAF
jgi:glycine/D-amino acid oxidase-like deaminating enzyme